MKNNSKTWMLPVAGSLLFAAAAQAQQTPSLERVYNDSTNRLTGSFAGPERWNGKVICDPSVLVEGDSIRVWFGGGDVASPDENLHGQIGVAHLIPKS